MKRSIVFDDGGDIREVRHILGCLFLFFSRLLYNVQKAFSFAFSYLCVLKGVRGSYMSLFTFSAKDATEYINFFSGLWL